MGKLARIEKLDLRLTTAAKRTLKEAADVSNRSVSEFVLQSALAQADIALSHRRVFELSPQRWKLFLEALDRPTQSPPRLSKLLNSKGYFDNET